MELKDLGEFGLIKRLLANQPTAVGVIVPPGDDAAVLEITPGQRVVLTCDCMVEDVHFLAKASGYDVGYKLLASNISDIAAMGGVPRYAVVTLVAHVATAVAWLDDLYAGLRACALEYGVAVVGGDTSRGDKVMLSVALLGEVAPFRELLRSSAKPGDLVCVTGPLGGSAAGLEVVLGKASPPERLAEEALARHYRPRPQVAAGLLIASLGGRCANDISDGLASEAHEVAAASAVEIEIDSAKVPQTEATVYIANAVGKDPLDFAFYGGEDYELLFTVPEHTWLEVQAALPTARVVGLVRAGQGVFVRRGENIRPLARGYTHFR
ncbi:MAG: thiamine-phosphate kinase [Firmicutes bacterium]|nr:thiamine-phosphate kinase [Dethiobacter sp.]MBS3889522.1 thiamine-phosphate kinase [Bacillota bacterium]